jgi:hypothetical protein
MDDFEFQHMIRHRNIFEKLVAELPRRSQTSLWKAADELATRRVEPEHAVGALEHMLAERSAAGITRLSAERPRLVERRRR